MSCSRSPGGYPSMPCRFPDPHSRVKFRGIWLGGVSRPTLGEGVCSGGMPGPGGWVGGDPPGWPVLPAVRILLECILVSRLFYQKTTPASMFM